MSELTVQSSPPSTENAIFSDNVINASSPPSSPPGFTWEQQKKDGESNGTLLESQISAFSILGKRKALEPITSNAGPAKKAKRLSGKREPKQLTQMQISLGQEFQKKCKKCGMEYIVSSSEDQKLHNTYHKQNEEGYDVGKLFIARTDERCLFDVTDSGSVCGDVITVVSRRGEPWRRKRAEAALDVVQRELGAVDIPEKDLWSERKAVDLLHSCDTGRFTALMYLRGTRCIGYLLMEQITEARVVVAPDIASTGKADVVQTRSKMSSLAALQARRQMECSAERLNEPVRLHASSSPAKLGISRIWTCSHYRSQRIATRLLDTALIVQRTSLSAISSRPFDVDLKHEKRNDSPQEAGAQKGKAAVPANISKDDVAFSQPTADGTRLARKWFGKQYGWKVYVD